MTTITQSIEFKWNLLDKYSITKDKRIFNTKTMREIKRTVNGYSVGYWLSGKFYTLKKINEIAVKIKKKHCPF